MGGLLRVARVGYFRRAFGRAFQGVQAKPSADVPRLSGMIPDRFMINYPKLPLGPEQAQGDDGQAVGSAIRMLPGGQHRPVDELIAELLAQPYQVLDVIVADVSRELHLERYDRAILGPLDNHVHLPAPGVQAKVRDLGCTRPGKHSRELVDYAAGAPLTALSLRPCLEQLLHVYATVATIDGPSNLAIAEVLVDGDVLRHRLIRVEPDPPGTSPFRVRLGKCHQLSADALTLTRWIYGHVVNEHDVGQVFEHDESDRRRAVDPDATIEQGGAVIARHWRWGPVHPRQPFRVCRCYQGGHRCEVLGSCQANIRWLVHDPHHRLAWFSRADQQG